MRLIFDRFAEKAATARTCDAMVNAGLLEV